MYDELAHIERLYGSVAEYYRVQEEKESEGYEPSEAEIRKSEISQAVYNEKIRLLNGEQSAFSKNMYDLWESDAPNRNDFEDYNTYVYAGYDYAHDRTLNLVDNLSQYHGVDVTDKSLYDTDSETFAVSVEYTEHSRILCKNINNLSYKKFKDVFRDFVAMRLWPTACYKDNKGKNHIYSNSSLGNLRISDFKWLGIETEESIQNELKELGFDEDACYKKIAEEYDRRCNV